MNTFNQYRWLKIALINFCVVALVGVTMRYKNIYPLAVLDQKSLMHGHSHFAFVGWVAMALMTIMVIVLKVNKVSANYKKYNYLLLSELINAYAMLISFIIEGYGVWSIIFSTVTILLSYIFIYYYLRDLRLLKALPLTKIWLKAAMALWAVSSLGAFGLAYLMMTHNKIQDLYFMSIYLFLHFQYNGWFLFACFGLFMAGVEKQLHPKSLFYCKRLLLMMSITVAPTYFLSILWLHLPRFIIYLADTAGIIQLLVLVYFIPLVYRIGKDLCIIPGRTTKQLWQLSCFAFILKIVLQVFSTVPYLNSFAFSVRPIVIGYLHLCFVGIISLFLLGIILPYIVKENERLQAARFGLLLFLIGFLVQELLLLLQGVEVMQGNIVRYAGQILLYAALCMAIGLIWFTTQAKTNKSLFVKIRRKQE